MSQLNTAFDLLDPFPWYQRMRDSQPVVFDPARGAWLVFRYEDVSCVLTDHVTFSSQAFLPKDFPPTLTFSDPPGHNRLRRLVSQALTPRAVERLAPRITEIAQGYLEQNLSRREMDVVDDYSYPLAVTVIAELLGVPMEDCPVFRQWGDTIAGSASALKLQIPSDMVDYFHLLIEERREVGYPEDDLISDMLAAQVEGERKMSDEEIIGISINLLIAGSETTRLGVAWSIFCLDAYPEAMVQLRANPQQLPGAIEEVLRFRSPFPAGTRVALRQKEIEGQLVGQGQFVVAFVGSANHDERVFTEPETFDISRSPNPHLAFGDGIHFCLGAPLARLEMQIALKVLLQRLTRIERVQGAPLEPSSGGFAYGIRHLPITFNA